MATRSKNLNNASLAKFNMMQRYSTLIQTSFGESKTKQPKIANNRIYTSSEYKTEYFMPSMKKQGLSLQHNRFYKKFPDDMKVLIQKLSEVEFKDVVIETLEEMG